MTGHTDIIVSTTVEDTASTTQHVTNRLVIVIGDAFHVTPINSVVKVSTMIISHVSANIFH